MSVVGSLKRTLKCGDRAPTEAQVFRKYEKVCVTVDEIIHEVREGGKEGLKAWVRHRC